MHIAVVEDAAADRDLIVNYLERLSATKTDIKLRIETFPDAVTFLENYKPVYDLVFLDIMMPYIDGMRAAEKLRKIDSSVLIIFTTNMGDYAVKGYDVGATAFMKKPIQYEDFKLKMQRAIFTIQSRNDNGLLVSSQGSRYRVRVRDIMYVAVTGHICTYHMVGGENIEERNTLKILSNQLKPYDFMLCSSNYLINPCYIKVINVQTVTVGDDLLEISRLKRKQFLMQFNEWVAKGGCLL